MSSSLTSRVISRFMRSYFVQAHFHYTIMGGEVFALMAGIVYYLPKMTGLSMDTKLLRFQFWAVFLTFNGTFLSLIAVGIMGMTRRVISYARISATTQHLCLCVCVRPGRLDGAVPWNLDLAGGDEEDAGDGQSVGVAGSRVAAANTGADIQF